MSVLDALEIVDNRPEFTLVGEPLKDYPPFFAQIRQQQ